MRILITGPELSAPGGVAGFYGAVLPHLRAHPDVSVSYMEVGGALGRGNLPQLFIDQSRFVRMISEINPDIVHINPSLNLKSLLRDGWLVRNARRCGRPVLVFMHGWDVRFEPLLRRYLAGFFRKTLARANCYVVLASEFARKLKDFGITVPIHVGATAVADDLLEGFSLDEKLKDAGRKTALKVLFLARVEVEKGVLETIDAIAVLRERGIAVQLTVAGAGHALDVAKTRVSRLGMDSEISFSGYVRGEDKRMIFTEHDIYCLPTMYGEGLPTSVLEAMAFGLPVITCPAGGLRDIFEVGRMGYFVEKTASDVAQAIERLALDPGERRRMARYNHEYAIGRFLGTVVARSLVERYRELIHG